MLLGYRFLSYSKKVLGQDQVNITKNTSEERCDAINRIFIESQQITISILLKFLWLICVENFKRGMSIIKGIKKLRETETKMVKVQVK